MRVALVYDRVNKWGGAERILLALHELFPEAPLFTSVYNPKTAPWAKVFPKVFTSFLQNFSFANSAHELYATLMPIAFESFNFDAYDLVISVTSEAAKGIITKPHTKHICYCLTPTRYLWSGYETYFRNGLMRTLSTPVVSYLRVWDKIAAQRPDVMVGISKTVVGRIKQYYGREAEVVYPPVDSLTGPALGFPPASARRSPARVSGSLPPVSPVTINEKRYFLLVSRLVPYKRVDLAIEAFNKLSIPLVIVGRGSEERRLRAMASENIHFVSYLTDRELARYYEKATALIFPQEEDFGLVAVEAQLMGTPVIAYKMGGALETVIPGKTGEFFNEQTPDSLVRVVKGFGRENYNSEVIKRYAKKFSKERFNRELLRVLRL